MRRVPTVGLLLSLLVARAAAAQLPETRGYYLNVPLWSDSTPFAVGGFGDLQRLRFMSAPAIGPIDLDIAYEHILTYSERAVAAPLGAILAGAAPGGGEWLDLQWTIEESRHWLWRHRFDRLNLSYAPSDAVELTLGRQTISWATTLFLTPADPFVPFDPADPFREYRAGVDALRVQAYPGPLSEIDVVLRASDTAAGSTTTLLSRGRTVWRGWEISAWAGALHEEPALGLGAAGALGAAALRFEASLREEDDELVLRGTFGTDTRVDAFGRDLYLLLEYQRDEFGAKNADALTSVVLSKPFARGELQVLGRDVAAAQAVYQVHPLWATDLLFLWNLNDGSALVGAGTTYSASNEVALRAGLFLGLGDDASGAPLSLPSEYGIVPTVLYASLTAFF